MDISKTDVSIDVIEICGLLQCLGFHVKSLDTRDGNTSLDCAKTITINCQASGMQVILESGDMTCSCPVNANESNSGFWQVSGMTGGKLLNKETGSGLLGSLPRIQKEQVTKELQKIINCIKVYNESDVDKPKEGNKSTSMIELNTPEKKHFELKAETPTRYRSLDTLTTKDEGPQTFPPPGLLQRQIPDSIEQLPGIEKKFMCQRQSTYTLSSTPGSTRRRNKTSSPIQPTPSSTHILESLIAAEKGAEEIRNILAQVVKELTEDAKNDSSMSSLVLDVSKISLLKGPESSKQFSSSPNLSALGMANDDITRRLKRFDSASTSNLASDKTTNKDGKQSRIRKISPGLFKLKKDNKDSIKTDRKTQDSKSSRLISLLKPKATPTPTSSKVNSEPSPNLSATRKKFSHVKSTIPRPASKKD